MKLIHIITLTLDGTRSRIRINIEDIGSYHSLPPDQPFNNATYTVLVMRSGKDWSVVEASSTIDELIMNAERVHNA